MRISNPQHSRGSVLLVIVVLIFVLCFIGYTLWQIWKAINQAWAGHPVDSQAETRKMIADIQATNNQTVTVVSTQAVTFPAIQFEASLVNERIWRSTNLTDWEVAGTNTIGQAWTDPVPPWPNAFYKREAIK